MVIEVRRHLRGDWGQTGNAGTTRLLGHFFLTLLRSILIGSSTRSQLNYLKAIPVIVAGPSEFIGKIRFSLDFGIAGDKHLSKVALECPSVDACAECLEMGCR
jgi:hypothetical protein